MFYLAVMLLVSSMFIKFLPYLGTFFRPFTFSFSLLVSFLPNCFLHRRSILPKLLTFST